jgi:Putative Ig domain
MYELQQVLERQVRKLARSVLGQPQRTALDRSPEAGMSVWLRGHERMFPCARTGGNSSAAGVRGFGTHNLRMRLVLALVLAAAFAAIATSDALAVRFADTPCVETGDARSRVCPVGVVGSPYAIQLKGEGGCGPDPNVPGSGLPYQFRVLSGSVPPGLSLDRDGRVHGTPTQAGTWSVWIELSDEDPPSAAWCRPMKSEREFIVTVAAPPGTVGSAYALQVRADGAGAQTWSVGSGVLPQGLTLGETTGLITGTPSIPGAFPLELLATDSRGVTVPVELTIVVYPKLALATKRLAVARVGRAYRAIVKTSGSVSPVTFTALSGRLPVGVRLNTKTGVLTGKPRNPGTYRVTIAARDGLQRTAKQTYVLTVRPLAPRRA